MANEQIIRQYNTPQDRASLIERFDPTPIIAPIVEQLLGIRTIVNRTGTEVKVSYKRYNQPIFTEEYVRVIEGILRGSVNNVTSFSKFSKEEIRLRVINMFQTHGDSIGTMGNDHYISQETWQQVLAIHESGKLTEEPKDGKFVSGWLRWGIDWNYNSPVTFDMITHLKDFSEQVGQEVTFSIIAQTIRTNIMGCLNRSLEMPDGYYGMTTNLIGETTVEKNSNNVNERTATQETW